jgi:glycosyltransferase involved in cell wall biosynthesis
MPKPRVLVFIDWYLPGYKAGGPVRSVANLVDHLRDRIDFHIVARNTEYTESTPFAGITPDCWTLLPGGEKVWYASQAGTSRAAWKRILGAEPWDALYINGLYSWHYNILPLWLSQRMPARRIVAVRGMLAAGAMRHGALKKLLFLSMARLVDLYKGVCFQATNEEEAKEVRLHIMKHADVRVVPNLSRKLQEEFIPIAKQPGAVKLVSVARIAVEKNTLLAIDSLRNVQGRVEFILYGPVYDQGYWAKCQAVIAELPGHVQVVHRGALPAEKVSRVLAEHHALFLPSAGENFGHTMLESLCAGRPLLISDRTPWRDLEAGQAGWDLPLDRPEAFTVAVEKLCAMDQVEYDRWTQGALQRARHYLADPRPIEASFELFSEPNQGAN